MQSNNVSIVIPTYKRPQKLKRAITSVLQQTYRDVRVLVFDNASEDGTREIVEEIMASDNRVAYYCHTQNIGMIKNFNFAFAHVVTPFFGVLTDDDYFLPNYVEDALQAFQAYPSAKISILKAPEIDEQGKLIGDQLASWPKEGLYAAGENIEMVINGHHPIITGCILRQSVLQDMELDEKIGVVADVPLLIKLLSRYSFHISKKIGLYFVRHAEAGGYHAGSIADIFHCRLRMEYIVGQDLKATPGLQMPIMQMLVKANDKMLFRLMLRALRAKDDSSCFSLSQASSCRGFSFYRLGTEMVYQISRCTIAADALRTLIGAMVKLKYFRRNPG